MYLESLVCCIEGPGCDLMCTECRSVTNHKALLMIMRSEDHNIFIKFSCCQGEHSQLFEFNEVLTALQKYKTPCLCQFQEEDILNDFIHCYDDGPPPQR